MPVIIDLLSSRICTIPLILALRGVYNFYMAVDNSYMNVNNIYHGDSLYFLQDMRDNFIDLIYIDPPFGTQTLWKSRAFKEKVQDLQFYDVWGGGLNGYVEFMRERLWHMHRVLKPTGVLCVHLDWRMTHYIKVELDKIFKVKNPASQNTNFINEIVWLYKGRNNARKTYNKKHDTILCYSKSNDYTFNPHLRPLDPRDVHRYNKEDEHGRYALIKGADGKYRKCYLRKKGVINEDWWHIPYVRGNEYLGYPTQKPLKLLERFIKTFTNKGDVVADFFCGCGTAIDSAQSLERKWIGIDASNTACEVMQQRMSDKYGLLIDINKKPMTLKDFEKLSPFEFEKAAIRYIGGVTNQKQVADGGVDGRLAFDGTPIQVKKEAGPIGDTDRFRSFYEHLKQHGRGIFITLNGYKKPAKERAAQWRREGLDIQLLTIKDVLAGKFVEQQQHKKSAA